METATTKAANEEMDRKAYVDYVREAREEAVGELMTYEQFQRFLRTADLGEREDEE